MERVPSLDKLPAVCCFIEVYLGHEHVVVANGTNYIDFPRPIVEESESILGNILHAVNGRDTAPYCHDGCSMTTLIIRLITPHFLPDFLPRAKFIKSWGTVYLDSWRVATVRDDGGNAELTTTIGTGNRDGISGNDVRVFRRETSLCLSRQIWSMFYSELLLSRFKRSVGSLRSTFGSVGGFLNFWILLDNFSELTTHRTQLLECSHRISASNRNSNYFKNDLRYWRLIWSAVIGLALIFWGWYHVRRERRLNWGLAAFLFGIVFWGYTINSWLSL